MILVDIVCWVAGFALLVAGVAMIRAPLARQRELQANEENLRRYDAWRGNRLIDDDGRRTGADEMQALLRRRVRLWSAAIVGGIVLLVLGFLIR